MAASVSATALGPAPAASATFPATVTSGAFTYAGNEFSTEVGDGHDDLVTWDFDFSAHPDFPLSATDPLVSALLTVTVTPTSVDDGITTDAVGIGGLGLIITPVIQGLVPGETATISLELLEHYSSAEILGALQPGGAMSMVWQDDATITFAQLHLVQCRNHRQVTLRASASGPVPTETATFPATVTAGDFIYSANEFSTTVGDGHDDLVNWVFDFSADPNYPLSVTDPLQAARLTMTVTPTSEDDGITTDAVEIEGLSPIVSPVIQGLAPGETATITLELLDAYTSADILGALRGDGTIPMRWQDDVTITFAQLELVQ